MGPPLARLRLLCRGRVQGVGFRPAVHRLAAALGLGGTIRNVSGGVELQLDGPRDALERLLEQLPVALPAAAWLETLEPEWSEAFSPADALGLRITADPPRPLDIGLIAPSLTADRAPCCDCLRELADPTDRRFRYPFVSCCACGPRYSIATAEPWARAHTSLAGFPLCPACRSEFEDPANRRFHAETIGCRVCGPQLRLLDPQGQPWAGKGDAQAGEREADPSGAALAAAVALLRRGGILALQGVGGFQLLVDAADAEAVARLRARKRRPHKPFALLVDDLERLAPLLCPTPAERRALADPAAPIVLLPCRDDRHSAVLPGVAPAAPALGVMLPASPLHWLLARAFAGPLVATSGNCGGEPLCIDPAEALQRLAGIADAFLVHDRPIARPLDDSVLQVIDGRPALLRRARGYAPEPLVLAGAGPAVLALGGDLKSAPALALGDRLWLAPHLGDLADARVQDRWRGGVAELLERHSGDLAALAVDRHPGYLSHQGAAALLAAAGLADGVPLRSVGHHRAHGLAVAAEHGLALPLAVLALDGLGYGEGAAPLWGCELLWLERTGSGEGMRRLASLRPFPLPGGERAMREPRRSALGLLWQAGLLQHPGAAGLRGQFAAADLRLLEQSLASDCNAPRTSSAGRLFDAVAALLALVDVASHGMASHEAQAGLALQAAALRSAALRSAALRAEAEVPAEAVGAYPLPLLAPGTSDAGDDETPAQLDWLPLLQALLDDIHAGQPVELCAARFHNGLVRGLAEAVEALLPKATTLALAGGCFQNRLLLEGLISALRERGPRPCWSERLPLNDGGLAAGQVLGVRWIIAAHAGSSASPN
jgi:hydrogenase maturation protein HypF